MFSLRQLKAFVTVAENKSFTNAAKILFMTQPAISAQIKALEERLEVKLIERNDKTIALTEAGEVLFIEAQKILDIYDGFMEAIDEMKGIHRGKLFITASTIPGEYVLPILIGGFHRVYPGIEISLKIGDTGAVVQQLLKRTVDIGIIGAPVKNESISLKEFIKDELIIIGPPGNTKNVQEISVEELVEADLVLREPDSGTRMMFYEKISSAGVEIRQLKVVMELGSTRAIITAVESGLGLSVVSRLAAQEALELGKITEYRVRGISFERYLYLAWNKNKYESFAAKEFFSFLDSRKHEISSKTVKCQ
ncbi:MAG: LysR family transcriptional regulator [Firmicutes bacterium HGW-Firmicutes-14]|jgi:DNA-binding transcriptional LysR family regulator|nr:MAG: LysR family transcriptional regulator [Firmicutes bacterium HGW-Firmicutes-14]